jgi:hypothetical protein
MPAKSQKQANLMRAAAHGAQFPMAQKVRESMPLSSLADFASTEKPAPKSRLVPKSSKPFNPAVNLGAFHHPPKRNR